MDPQAAAPTATIPKSAQAGRLEDQPAHIRLSGRGATGGWGIEPALRQPGCLVYVQFMPQQLVQLRIQEATVARAGAGYTDDKAAAVRASRRFVD